jgi:hypothetical protein
MQNEVAQKKDQVPKQSTLPIKLEAFSSYNISNKFASKIKGIIEATLKNEVKMTRLI